MGYPIQENALGGFVCHGPERLKSHSDVCFGLAILSAARTVISLALDYFPLVPALELGSGRARDESCQTGESIQAKMPAIAPTVQNAIHAA
jgi:hypothetical protein